MNEEKFMLLFDVFWETDFKDHIDCNDRWTPNDKIKIMSKDRTELQPKIKEAFWVFFGYLRRLGFKVKADPGFMDTRPTNPYDFLLELTLGLEKSLERARKKKKPAALKVKK